MAQLRGKDRELGRFQGASHVDLELGTTSTVQEAKLELSKEGLLWTRGLEV